jgi:hypothetical protein
MTLLFNRTGGTIVLMVVLHVILQQPLNVTTIVV